VVWHHRLCVTDLSDLFAFKFNAYITEISTVPTVFYGLPLSLPLLLKAGNISGKEDRLLVIWFSFL